MSVQQVVLVNFQYEYTTRDGSHVSIKPNERYVLMAKTNDHWWHVRKDETAKPFFIPAKYVTVLPSGNEALQLSSVQDGQDNPKPYSETAPPLESVVENIKEQKSIKHPTADKKADHRISTFVIPTDQSKIKSSENEPWESKPENCNLYKDGVQTNIFQDALTNFYSPFQRENTYAVSQKHIPTTNLQTVTEPSEIQSNENEFNDDIRMLIRAGWDPKIWELKDDHVYDSADLLKDSVAQDNNVTEKKVEVKLGPASPVSPSSTFPKSFMQQSPCSPTDPSCVFTDKVEDDDLTAVYVNLPRARQSIGSLPSASAWGISESPELHDSLLLGSKGWEIHTDEDSGKEYYYHPSTGRSTWDYPLSPSMESEVGTKELPVSPNLSLSPACSPTDGARWTSDWEKVLDEKSGRHYFFNPISGQSSWDPPDDLMTPPLSGNNLKGGARPPLPEEDYPAVEDFPATFNQEEGFSFAGSSEYSLAHVKKTLIPRACLDRSAPAGWTLNVHPDGVWVFTNDQTQEQWIKSLDDRGQTYYYLKDGSKSEWNLPELSTGLRQCQLGNGMTGEQDGFGMMRTWRNSTGSQDEKLPSSHHRNASDSDMSGSPEILHNVSNLEKAGILNKTKISENGKKVRKNWAQSWTVLHGGVLTFHKDPRSNQTGTSNKTNQIVPEFTVDLKGATIAWAAKDKSSKKNVVELKSRAGAEYLIQYDTDSIITDWHKAITDTIRQLDMEQHSDDEEEVSEKSPSTEKEDKSSVDKRRMSNVRQLSTSSTSEADHKKVRNKLRKFLLKRPTLQSVKEKGYIRENVFGCHLQNLCAQEKSTVPSFVTKCIRTVENRGLGVDGIYRVSGNLAVIQKLRFKADHENLDLEDGPWDIHVITGALKLFFRELQEPLFPYSHFSSFVQGIKIPDYNTRVVYIRDLVKSLPPNNHDTMEALFSHLRKVIEHGDQNRMTLQNVAIVFGPTLLKPEIESANITAYMVFQNQIIEFILSEFETIFHM
ncbi:rho GTPase-activating protein 27 isoform X2 [Silurus meridionalis]|uniref:Rho GTPase-activating protein 27-like n=1 Tax=Silurus meridionalis TaxID=175797 RepID=A0A8T0BD22_SILME|nr:rho GTPase-activating protein 27 isoform X2 [Silurus meridionalis]KAF7705042.1 hypothetical protein HF521_020328 [Silurus meridionalis]